MQSENRVFDDIVKVLNGAAGTLAGVGRLTFPQFSAELGPMGLPGRFCLGTLCRAIRTARTL